MAKSTAIEISEFINVFENSKPDYGFAIADRFETLFGCYSCKLYEYN